MLAKGAIQVWIFFPVVLGKAVLRQYCLCLLKLKLGQLNNSDFSFICGLIAGSQGLAWALILTFIVTGVTGESAVKPDGWPSRGWQRLLLLLLPVLLSASCSCVIALCCHSMCSVLFNFLQAFPTMNTFPKVHSAWNSLIQEDSQG